MTTPKIVSEVPPPPLMEVEPPAVCMKSSTVGGPLEIYFRRKDAEDFVRYARNMLPNEVMALLIGSPYIWRRQVYAVVTDIAIGDTAGSSVDVRFTEKGLREIAVCINAGNPGTVLLGWIHSHPGHGTFLSATDERTQKMFTAPYQVAVVVDPVRQEFIAFKLNPYRQVGIGIMGE